MDKKFSRLLKTLPVFVVMGVSLAGCLVTKSSSDRAVEAVQIRLREARRINADLSERLKALELKYSERGRTLNEITTRYMDRKDAEARLTEARAELEDLIQKTEELRVYIDSTAQKKGGQVEEYVINEWLVQVRDLRSRLEGVLEKIR